MDIWTARDGRKIPVTKMSNEHLLNAHRMVREKLIDIENFQRNAFIFAPGEDTMAHDDFETAYLDSFERHACLSVWAEILGKEIERRGLKALESRIKVEKIKVKSIKYTEFGRIIEFERACGDASEERDDEPY